LYRPSFHDLPHKPPTLDEQLNPHILIDVDPRRHYDAAEYFTSKQHVVEPSSYLKAPYRIVHWINATGTYKRQPFMPKLSYFNSPDQPHPFLLYIFSGFVPPPLLKHHVVV
jgi:hypothetical protein